jgi:hypothetical protein
MRRRRDAWIDAAVVALAAICGCEKGPYGPPLGTNDAAVAQDGTAEAPDGTTGDAQPAPEGAVDSPVQPEAASNDGAAADAMTADAEVEAETTCAFDAGALDDAQVQLGQWIVATHRCHSCHGGALSGTVDGVLSPTTEGGFAYPPNLTPDPATGLGCWTDDEIENAFLNGIDKEGMPLCPPMPRFGHLDDGGIDAAQAGAVVQYLRSLPPFSQVVPDTPNCTVPDGGPGEGGSSVEAGFDDGSGAADSASDAADAAFEAAAD